MNIQIIKIEPTAHRSKSPFLQLWRTRPRAKRPCEPLEHMLGTKYYQDSCHHFVRKLFDFLSHPLLAPGEVKRKVITCTLKFVAFEEAQGQSE